MAAHLKNLVNLLIQSKNKPPSWLNKADDVYMEVYASKDFAKLEKWFSPSSLIKIKDYILDGEEKYFGIQKYRVRTWKKLDDERWLKTLTHKNININSISIKLGDNVQEIWTCTSTKVIDIERKEELS